MCGIMGITDFFANRTIKHDMEVDKDYMKRCEVKIKELCGELGIVIHLMKEPRSIELLILTQALMKDIF